MDGALGVGLPAGLAEVDPVFMTEVLRASGVIDRTNAVVSLEESGVGMTAGYFSDIKKVRCAYSNPTDAQDRFVVKAWPAFELLPKEALQAMFLKDIGAYGFPTERFYPRPQAILATADVPNNRWMLVMEDADTFAEHKVHEYEMTFDEVMRLVPKLVAVAVAWEGSHEGDKAEALAALGVDLWASGANLGLFKTVMPGGAKLFDYITTREDSSLISGPTWDRELGPGVAELFTKRLDAFYAGAHPDQGATCTLSHGDLRGDNIFFCDRSDRHPDGWLCIDFQLMFRGPVPSDLAYLMGTATVLPEVYSGPTLRRVVEAFYEQFMAKTVVYKHYSYDQFEREVAMMSLVHFAYAIGMGAAIWQAGAFANDRGARIELGGRGATEADLTPEELRQRMWWRKLLANYRENLRTFDQYSLLTTLPDSLDGLGPWVELPSHLQ